MNFRRVLCFGAAALIVFLSAVTAFPALAQEGKPNVIDPQSGRRLLPYTTAFVELKV